MRWYVAQTKPHAEDKAGWHLRRQGFATYQPQYLKRRSHARKVDFVRAPFFPCYLFLAMDPASARWRSIRSTLGVVRLVCNGENPAPVPDRIVEDLQAREDLEGLVSLPRAPGFTPGDRVELRGGALSGYAGLFDCANDEQRVTVLLDLLGRPVRVRVAREMIQAVA